MQDRISDAQKADILWLQGLSNFSVITIIGGMYAL